jgi:hypothetical protein
MVPMPRPPTRFHEDQLLASIPKDLLAAHEVKAWLGVTTHQVRRWILDKGFPPPCTKVSGAGRRGGTIRWPADTRKDRPAWRAEVVLGWLRDTGRLLPPQQLSTTNGEGVDGSRNRVYKAPRGDARSQPRYTKESRKGGEASTNDSPVTLVSRA